MSNNMDLILQEIRSLRSETNERFDQVDARLDKMDARLDGMDARLDKMDARFDQVDVRLDKMDARFDQVDARLDKMDTRLDHHESMIEQLISMSGTFIQNVQQMREELLEDRQLNQARHESVMSELSGLRADIEFTYEKASRNELELHRLQHRQSG